MWGIGCILYEMIYCSYVENEFENRFAFINKDNDKSDKTDQAHLIKIMETLGPQ